MYILGIITGLLISLVIFAGVFFATVRFKSQVEQKVNEIISATKPRGSVIEPQSEELQDWIDNLKEE